MNTNSNYRVIVADPMHEDGLALLKEKFHVEVFQPSQKAECREAIKYADAVIVRTFVIDSDLLGRALSLKAIVKHGAGVDNINIPEATARGITVANSGDANAESVAEATVSLMFAALRRTNQMHRAMVEGNYDIRWNLLLEGISGKTLGIVGLGNIGRRVARMCRDGFGMSIIALDPFLTKEDMKVERVIKVESLDELLQKSDIVSLNSGMKHGDKALIGAHELSLMRKHAVIVNTARGGMIDELALAQSLSQGQIYGAGLDVLSQEPPDANHPLLKLDNVVLAPHIGGATSSARRLMATRSAEAVINILGGQTPQFPLNFL
ncbi:MAG: hydroxyacid dehydrogenase [Betaproteobacteria bacterium]